MQLLNAIKNRRGFLACCLMFALFYMSHGCYYPYITLYYKQIGLSVQQISVISAIGPCLAMLVQTAWGRFADLRGRRLVLSITLVLSGLTLLLFNVSQTFAFTLFVAGLYVVVSTASLPLTDTIALDYCSASGFRFAPIRLCGTIGFGIMPLFVGGIMARSITNIFPMYCLFCLLAMGACFLVPSTQVKREANANDDKEQKKGKNAILEMLRDPVIQFVLVANFAVSLCMSIVGFLPVYASDMGMSTERTGMLNTISAAFEVPFFLLIDLVLKKRKSENLMLASLGFSFLRMMFAFVGGFFPQQAFYLLGGSQMLHSVSYIMLYYCSAQLIHRHVRDDVKATAQTLVATVSMGISRAIGSLMVGWIGEVVGLQVTYLIFGLLVVVFTLPVYLLYRRMKAAQRLQTVQEG